MGRRGLLLSICASYDFAVYDVHDLWGKQYHDHHFQLDLCVDLFVRIFPPFFLNKNRFYILYYTQLIFGKKSAQFGIDDYVLAAVCLYVEIIGLFIELLTILNECT